MCPNGLTAVVLLNMQAFPDVDIRIISTGVKFGVDLLVTSEKYLRTMVRTNEEPLRWYKTINDITIQTNVWNCLAVTWAREKGAAIYINGTHTAIDTKPVVRDEAGPFPLKNTSIALLGK